MVQKLDLIFLSAHKLKVIFTEKSKAALKDHTLQSAGGSEMVFPCSSKCSAVFLPLWLQSFKSPAVQREIFIQNVLDSPGQLCVISEG